MTGKKWLIPALWASFASVLLGLLVLGGYAVLNSMFPMASPVDYPDAESITSFSLIPKSDALVIVEPPDCAKYLQKNQQCAAYTANEHE